MGSEMCIRDSGSTHGGIDLNRNYSFNWGECEDENCSVSDACSATYRGESPASEPEMQAIENYLTTNFPDNRGPLITDTVSIDAQGIFMDVHSYGGKILRAWGNAVNSDGSSPNETELATFSRKLGGFNNYDPIRGIDFYPTDGSSKDYGYGELGLATVVLEFCLLYTSPSPRDLSTSRMPSSA